jgi:hypothetical protein
MNEQETNNLIDENTEQDDKINELEIQTEDFLIEETKFEPISSAETIIKEDASAIEEEDIFSSETEPPHVPADAALINQELETSAEAIEELEAETGREDDPIFQELAAPKLPRLEKENRARLQMQSPNRIYFYWSLKNNPYQTLNRAFAGQIGSYTLVAKMINETQEREEIFPVEAEGNWWFETNAGSSYRAEIGFYAPNRPFIRVLYSNKIETPRKNPSPRRAETKDWAVSANQFAKVLDVSGFSQDAFEVAFAGDDLEFADNATQNAFSQITGTEQIDSVKHDLSEVRYALLALASGVKLENLRSQISLSLYNKMRENAEKMSAENALAALQENFGEFVEETEERMPTVFGASLINFPRKLKRKVFPKFSPISSFR